MTGWLSELGVVDGDKGDISVSGRGGAGAVWTVKGTRLTAPLANNTYRGTTISGFNAGATLALWTPIRMGSGGSWLAADADGSGTFPAHALAGAVGSSGNPLPALVDGIARNDSWSWTPGGVLYLSTSSGLTQTDPSGTGVAIQRLGFALSATVIRVQIGQGEYLVLA